MEKMICGLKEVKTSDSSMEFEGYGAVFGNVDSYGDVIAPGAFASFLADVKSGAQPWPALLSQHGGWQMTAQDMTPIGVWTDFAEDGHGLKVSGVLADTERGIEHYKLLKMAPRPALDGMSIGYIAKAYEPRSKPEDPRRKLTKIDLIEVSLVTRPANGKARVTGVKSALEMTERQIEQTLRDVLGLSSSEAKTVIGHGFKTLLKQRDAGEGELAEIAALLRRNQTILKGN
jgi:HK97 family phage prohead protease